MDDVICDWLDVTCSPLASFVDPLNGWLNRYLSIKFQDDGAVGFQVDGASGFVKLERKRSFHRASFSGGALFFFRQLGLLGELARLVGSVPHAVTRLDAALDVDQDFPAYRKLLKRRHKATVNLGSRKSLKVTELLSTRDDGLQSGTWYAGHRQKAQVTGRVYDKQLEALEKRGELLPPRTRVELTFRKGSGVTLSDFLCPGPVFWAHSAPLVPSRLVQASPWTPGDDSWASPPGELPGTSYEDFVRRLETSAEVTALCRLAAGMGPNAWPVVERQLLKVFKSGYERELDSCPGG